MMPEERKAPSIRKAAETKRTSEPTAAKARKPVPAFASEAAEREFWESHDSTGYIDWSSASRVQFPRLKPTSKAISLRLPIGLLEALRVEAKRRDVPYQSLIKVWLSEKIAKKTPAG